MPRNCLDKRYIAAVGIYIAAVGIWNDSCSMSSVVQFDVRLIMLDCSLLIIGIERKVALHALVRENFFEELFVIFHKYCTSAVQSWAFLSQLFSCW